MERGSPATAGSGHARDSVRTLAWLSVIAAGAYFLVRGVWRATMNSGDLKYGFTSARAWLEGLDPYDQATLGEMAEAGRTGLSDATGLLNVYPPATIAAFAPVGIPDWDVARVVFLAVNVVLIGFVAAGLIRFLSWSLTATPSLFLIAFILALGPVHTTMSSGQPAIIAVAAIVAAMLLGQRYSGVAGGALYGLSAVIKIQVGLPFLAYLLGRRRWVAAVAAVAVVITFTIVAVVRLESAGVGWLGTWAGNLDTSFGPGGFNSTEPTNDARISLINLQYPLRMLGLGEFPANIITVALVAVAALLTLKLARDDAPEGELLSLSIVGVLTLLVTYHRFYDAVLLVLPVAWAIWAIVNGRAVLGGAVVLATATFLVPGQVALFRLAESGLVPDALTRSALWDAGLLAYHAWTLVALSIILLVAAYVESRGRAHHQVVAVSGETAGTEPILGSRSVAASGQTPSWPQP